MWRGELLVFCGCEITKKIILIPLHITIVMVSIQVPSHKRQELQ